ncbi:MAG: fasciclin domain-containing protein [Thermoleophilia bacterium]|nr:fasciclin domain-containing protein [Thermoleophilia bacterium]MDH4339397.1 fasciclin domain-containing protein [Thermoleophilia bacterium]
MKARIAVLLAIVTGTAAFAATAPAAPAESSAATAKNCVVVASSNRNFSTLVALVKQAGLAKTLSGKGPFTIMAPTNAAFAKLKKTAPDTYKAVTTDKALLTKVLTYHVIGAKVPAAAAIAVAKKNGSVKTVEGEKIKLSLKGASLFLNGNAKVIAPDVRCSNGIIHGLNNVLVPPSIA